VIILARWLSILAHPFVMVGILVGVAAAGRGGTVVSSLSVVAIFTVIPMAVLMVRQVRSGAWENVDASNRRERGTMFAVGGATMGGLLIFVTLVQPQSFLLRGVLGTLAMFAACAVATKWIKVSLHMAFATFTTTILALSGSAIGLALVPLVPALAWSRLVLERHTPRELVLGAAIGGVAAAAMYWL
jgi:hypothetical protein